MKPALRHVPLLLPLLVCTLASAEDQKTDVPAAADKPVMTAETTPIDFITVDKDASGALSVEETAALTDLHDAFQKLDVDRNMSLSPAEYANWSRAGKLQGEKRDPATVPGGSAGAQHRPEYAE